ncbi:hypothetical protein EGR_10958 [Echinococcus granulosus]|uniref:Uncharacterized protein n=1 Tax=Echinococcus granulosus TaxID=6210 RepID=W6U136_ECHGR|nr:hypothetical protein EGR_10958 [Echinococcus granulosus]EUB54186.1 hypothetical protein EGR_10958 [Echinococcus granulosus]
MSELAVYFRELDQLDGRGPMMSTLPLPPGAAAV